MLLTTRPDLENTYRFVYDGDYGTHHWANMKYLGEIYPFAKDLKVIVNGENINQNKYNYAPELDVQFNENLKTYPGDIFLKQSNKYGYGKIAESTEIIFNALNNKLDNFTPYFKFDSLDPVEITNNDVKSIYTQCNWISGDLYFRILISGDKSNHTIYDNAINYASVHWNSPEGLFFTMYLPAQLQSISEFISLKTLGFRIPDSRDDEDGYRSFFSLPDTATFTINNVDDNNISIHAPSPSMIGEWEQNTNLATSDYDIILIFTPTLSEG